MSGKVRTHQTEWWGFIGHILKWSLISFARILTFPEQCVLASSFTLFHRRLECRSRVIGFFIGNAFVPRTFFHD